MKDQSAKRSSLFLFELLIAILFFSLCSAVCVNFFVKSHTLSADAHNLNMAVNEVSAYAERFRAENDFEEQFLADGNAALLDDGAFAVFYNDDWETCGEKDCRFCLVIRISKEGQTENATFAVSDTVSGEEIYAVTLKKYTAREEDYES